jgi:hypothetical protein
VELTKERIILDRGFERALKTVLDAFTCEGFTISPGEAGDLHRPDGVDGRRRYALLDATLIDSALAAACASPGAPPLKCQVSMFELARACTLVTIASAGTVERVRDVIRVLLRTGTLNAA